MWWKQPTKTTSEPAPDPRRGATTGRPSQDLGEIKVEVDHLQATSEQKEVIVFLKIFNKTPKDLAIVRGDSQPFVTDSKGFSYRLRDSSGIKSGQHNRESWTYIPSSGNHTISLRFHNYSSEPKRDSIYSISAEVVLASRDDLERTPAGRRPDGARTVNIAIHGIEAQ
jgi:hypothetical protein